MGGHGGRWTARGAVGGLDRAGEGTAARAGGTRRPAAPGRMVKRTGSWWAGHPPGLVARFAPPGWAGRWGRLGLGAWTSEDGFANKRGADDADYKRTLWQPVAVRILSILRGCRPLNDSNPPQVPCDNLGSQSGIAPRIVSCQTGFGAG